jgi:hypothetical protein
MKLEKLVERVVETRQVNDGMPVETLVEVDQSWWRAEETPL